MVCPILKFYLSLNSNHWRLDVILYVTRSFFQDISKPTSCLHHLIPPARDTSVTTRLRLATSLPRPNLHMKKYCLFINHYQPIQWLLTHSTHLSQHLCICVHIVLFRLLFLSFYYFNCISLAIRLSGRKVAIKLIDWWLRTSARTLITSQIPFANGQSKSRSKDGTVFRVVHKRGNYNKTTAFSLQNMQ